jgi:hypothetical protein
LYTVFVHF